MLVSYREPTPTAPTHNTAASRVLASVWVGILGVLVFALISYLRMDEMSHRLVGMDLLLEQASSGLLQIREELTTASTMHQQKQQQQQQQSMGPTTINPETAATLLLPPQPPQPPRRPKRPQQPPPQQQPTTPTTAPAGVAFDEILLPTPFALQHQYLEQQQKVSLTTRWTIKDDRKKQLRRVSPFVAAMASLQMGKFFIPDPMMDFAMYFRLYRDVFPDNWQEFFSEEMKAHWRDRGKGEGKLANAFSDYDIAHAANRKDAVANGGQYVGGELSLQQYLVWDEISLYNSSTNIGSISGISGCCGSNSSNSSSSKDYFCVLCHWPVRAYKMCNVLLINTADEKRANFVVGDQIIGIGNSLFAGEAHSSGDWLPREREWQYRSVASFVKDKLNSYVVEVVAVPPTTTITGVSTDDTVFSFLAPLSNKLWYGTYELFQMLRVYTGGGYDCPVLVDEPMYDAVSLYIPRERIILMKRGHPHLFRNVIIVKKVAAADTDHYSSSSSVRELAQFAESLLPTSSSSASSTFPALTTAVSPQPPRSVARVLMIGFGCSCVYAAPVRGSLQYNNWKRLLFADVGGEEFIFSRGNSSNSSSSAFPNTMVHLFDAKTLVTDWSQGLMNAWLMKRGSLIFVVVHRLAVLAAGQEPDRAMTEHMEAHGIHLYAQIVGENEEFDEEFSVRLLTKVEQVIYNTEEGEAGGSGGFDWRRYVRQTNTQGVITSEHMAINLLLRCEKWPGAEMLPVPDHPRIKELIAAATAATRRRMYNSNNNFINHAHNSSSTSSSGDVDDDDDDTHPTTTTTTTRKRTIHTDSEPIVLDEDTEIRGPPEDTEISSETTMIMIPTFPLHFHFNREFLIAVSRLQNPRKCSIGLVFGNKKEHDEFIRDFLPAAEVCDSNIDLRMIYMEIPLQGRCIITTKKFWGVHAFFTMFPKLDRIVVMDAEIRPIHDMVDLGNLFKWTGKLYYTGRALPVVNRHTGYAIAAGHFGDPPELHDTYAWYDQPCLYHRKFFMAFMKLHTSFHPTWHDIDMALPTAAFDYLIYWVYLYTVRDKAGLTPVDIGKIMDDIIGQSNDYLHPPTIEDFWRFRNKEHMKKFFKRVWVTSIMTPPLGGWFDFLRDNSDVVLEFHLDRGRLPP